MQLNPSEISDLLKKRIEGLGVSADLRTQARRVGDRRYLPLFTVLAT